jgi:predicted  nucleic acid-binding Zn-ribbon protein
VNRLQNDINELKKSNDSLVDETTHLKSENLNIKKEKQVAEDEIVNLKRRIKLIRRNVSGDIKLSDSRTSDLKKS